MKLNLGCGQNLMDGHVNVDKYPTFNPDVLWDLEKFPWPFETSSAEDIAMVHSLEHMGADTEVFLGIMKELHRVCVPGGRVHITVPHPRSDNFLNDPSHVRPVTHHMMGLFSKEANRQARAMGWANTPFALYIDVDFEVEHVTKALNPYWGKKLQTGEMTAEEVDFAVDTYYNVISEIKMVLKVCK